MLKRFFLSFILLMTLTGCAAKMRVFPQLQPGQDVVYRSGQEAILSEQPDSRTIMLPEQKIVTVKMRPSVIFAIQNKGEEAIQLSEDSVSAFLNDRIPLHVYTFNELVAEQNCRASWQRGFLVANAILNVVAATQTNHYDTYHYNRTYTDTRIDLLQTEMHATNIEVNNNEILGELEAAYLKKHTLLPGETVVSRVEFENIPACDIASNVTLLVDTGNDGHLFSIDFIKQ